MPEFWRIIVVYLWNILLPACNVNDVVPEYLRTEILQPKETVATISNTMDVGDQVILCEF